MKINVLLMVFLAGMFFFSVSYAKQPAELNPESLPEIAAKQFDGRELKIVKSLAQNDKYTRYLITYKSGVLKISGIM